MLYINYEACCSRSSVEKNKYKQLAFPYSTDSLNAAMHASIYLFMMIINVEAITDFCLLALVSSEAARRIGLPR
jgi:hypothetical protein